MTTSQVAAALRFMADQIEDAASEFDASPFR